MQKCKITARRIIIVYFNEIFISYANSDESRIFHTNLRVFRNIHSYMFFFVISKLCFVRLLKTSLTFK